MQVQWYHEVVGTLEPYHMLKNSFELTALKYGRDAKTLGSSTCAWAGALALVPTASSWHPSHLVKLSLPFIFLVFNEVENS